KAAAPSATARSSTRSSSRRRTTFLAASRTTAPSLSRSAGPPAIANPESRTPASCAPRSPPSRAGCPSRRRASRGASSSARTSLTFPGDATAGHPAAPQVGQLAGDVALARNDEDRLSQPDFTQQLEDARGAALVQLRERIIQQEHGGAVARVAQRRRLQRAQGDRRGALLPGGTELPQLATVEQHAEVVAMRPERREPHPQIGGVAGPERLGDELLDAFRVRVHRA